MTWRVQHVKMRSVDVNIEPKDLFTDTIKVMLDAVPRYSDIVPLRYVSNAQNRTENEVTRSHIAAREAISISPPQLSSLAIQAQ
jgi:hypothetical protein